MTADNANRDPGGASRTLTVQWQDPFISARRARQGSGLDFLRALVAGEIPQPPIAQLLGFRLIQIEPGFAVFEFEPGECHYNPIGVVHGGLSGVLLDSAMGCAVQTTVPAGSAYTTLEYKVNLVRAITMKTGKLRAEGRVVHAGKRAGTAEGRIVDADGKVYAHGSTTCLIFPVE